MQRFNLKRGINTFYVSVISPSENHMFVKPMFELKHLAYHQLSIDKTEPKFFFSPTFQVHLLVGDITPETLQHLSLDLTRLVARTPKRRKRRKMKKLPTLMKKMKKMKLKRRQRKRMKPKTMKMMKRKMRKRKMKRKKIRRT